MSSVVLVMVGKEFDCIVRGHKNGVQKVIS